MPYSPFEDVRTRASAWGECVRFLWLRQLGLALCALLALAAAPALAAGASQTSQAKATVIKPLVLKWVQDLDLGTILLASGTWSGATVGISQSGVRSCSNPNTTCSGAFQMAKYNVSGSNNQTVTISAPNVTLVNQSDPRQTLTLVVDSPGTVLLTNSGPPGKIFSLGGSIDFSSDTASGTYSGTFNVTVNY